MNYDLRFRGSGKPKMNCDLRFRGLGKPKMNCDLRFRSLGKPKMNCDFASRSLRKAKMNYDFASRSLRKPKMNCDFASRSIRRRKNELRFRFPEYPEMQKGIAVWLRRETGKPERNCDTHAMCLLSWRDKLWQGFIYRQGRPKRLTIPMQRVFYIRETSCGAASWSGRDTRKRVLWSFMEKGW